ncbi:VCBS repeat-containing protein [Flavivirga amylovorans]|uniref:VCBS repeat-containing protein n=2 Tax=Flavivirga amylovorans TaxID=870486 RepID=A0ABT8X3A4_9FLAO|nr:VCBS repeat-containing protein [Flavivirga amylovorans]MDO5988423.1 VCBS repeat-containing protein [Flavivirga amylovorans]
MLLTTPFNKTLWLYVFCLWMLFGCKKEKAKKEIIFEKETLFKSLSSKETGISFNNTIEENPGNFFIVYNYAYNGGGVAIGDINNDGLSDIYFTGNQVENKLYLNKGNFRFEDITSSAGVGGGDGWDNGVVMVDVNGDSFLDIYVCKGGWRGTDAERTNLLYINNGDNTFSEQAKQYNIADTGFSMMASFFDMDNDNDLDMYLINRPKRFFLSHDDIKKGKEEQSPLYRDKLYENVNGVYKEIGLKSGINQTYAYGLGLSTSDLNNDGFSDIYVANDYFESDYFFKNKGNKTFSQNIQSITNHVAFYGMGIDVVDFNNDGYEDLVELDMTSSDHVRAKTTMASMNVDAFYRILEAGNHYQYMHNMLQINNGNGFFSEIGQFAGIDKTDWSWSCLGSDFDNDGLRDLFISNGFRRDIFDKDATSKFSSYIESKEKKKRSKSENVQHIVSLFNENKISNYIYKNNGDLKFSNKIKDWGLEAISFSNGAAVGDLDNDGDLDLIVNNINDAAFVYKNNSEKSGNNYLKVKLKGPKNNTLGLGAKITVFNKDSIQYHELKNVRGYLSSVEPIAHFGLGKTNVIDSVKVVWPDKKVNLHSNLKVNTVLTVDYKEANRLKLKKEQYNPVFKDITKHAFLGKQVTHKENEFDDFKTQILLPHKLSTEGPCISVADVNNDGFEDFYLGGAVNQSGRLFLQKKHETFVESKQTSFLKDKNYEDVASVFFDANKDGAVDLYVASGGNEFHEKSPEYQDRLYLNDGKGHFVKSNNFPEITSSGGCVLPLDYDDDGDLDLFVGGRLVPNRYPAHSKSYLLQNNSGFFTDVTSQFAKDLEFIGMVTDAVWQDIDGDSKNELLVVGEWMPISLFQIKDGVFEKLEHPTLNKTNGWWNTIEAKDIDLDGDIDFIVGNLGENYKFKASEEKPFYVFASDYDKNGTNDVFLAKDYKDKIVPVRGKECSTEQLPSLSKKFATYNEFAISDIGTILDDKALTSQKHEAYTFQSVFLINNGGVLEIKKLPNQAQYSTVQSIVVNDFNKDGINDVLLTGNKFNVEIETTRADASVGLLLNGIKNFDFKEVKPTSSGVFLPFNVKESKAIKLGENAQGILVGINNGSIRLLKASN